MKRCFRCTVRLIVAIALTLAMTLSSSSCKDVKVYEGKQHYHRIFDIEQVQKYGLSSNYKSMLMLTPRTAPSGLEEFYFRSEDWLSFFDYTIYFTYTLDDDTFFEAKEGFRDFHISVGSDSRRPVYTADVFAYPAYILSWVSQTDILEPEKAEYVLLDEDNNTVINVYVLYNEISELQSVAKYNIAPKEDRRQILEQLIEERGEKGSFDISNYISQTDKTEFPVVYDSTFLNGL